MSSGLLIRKISRAPELAPSIWFPTVVQSQPECARLRPPTTSAFEFPPCTKHRTTPLRVASKAGPRSPLAWSQESVMILNFSFRVVTQSTAHLTHTASPFVPHLRLG